MIPFETDLVLSLESDGDFVLNGSNILQWNDGSTSGNDVFALGDPELLQDQTPTVESREETASLTEIKNDFAFPATVSDLMPDAKSGSVIAICKGQRQWYSISADGGRSIEHQAAAPITCATLIDGQLYLCLESPSRLQKIAIQTGKVEKEWNLKSSRPSSVAVVPVQDVAFVSDRKMLHKVDLLSGSITNTDYYCDLVTSDPLQKFCYTQVRDEGESGHMFVDGRAIRFSIRDRWTQTALYQHAVADRDVLLSAMRMNASSNGRRLYVSPDGHWVASVGGGGWRPTSSSAGEGSGYGIAVFRAADFSRVQGFYETDAYPLGVAINPVTRQLVAVRAKDAKIHQLSKAKDAVTVAGAFTGAAAWSSDGGTLFLASGKKLRVWQNSLSTSEQQLARAWLANLSQRMARRKTKTERAIGVVAVKEMATFALKKTKSDVQSMLKKAGSVSGEIKPMEWLQHEPYQSDPQLKQFFAQASRSVQNPRDIGILIYRLRSMKKKHPEHPGFDFLLGIATFTAGDFEKCIEHQLEAIHTDQGKTNITIEALRCLAHGHKREKQPLTAAYCMATVLRLDPTNPRWQKEATPFFEATGLMAEAKPVLDGRTAASSSPAVTVAVNLNLPELGSPKSRRKYDGRRLFQKVAPSTVVIKTEGGSGSGVCVGRPGIILTNQHVVRGVDGKVDVHPFAIRSGRLVRLSALKADVVYQSVRDDIAILQIAKAPRTLLPLEVSTSEPDSGTRIYAVGSPGLGSRILDQTISEGIVSSPSRELDGQSFIQHTAAVNPGNSGGPVLNELGHVVGIVTLKARLENVSFAIPATTVRKTFETLRKK